MPGGCRRGQTEDRKRGRPYAGFAEAEHGSIDCNNNKFEPSSAAQNRREKKIKEVNFTAIFGNKKIETRDVKEKMKKKKEKVSG